MSAPIRPQPAFGEPLPPRPRPEVLDFLATRRSASALTLAAPGPSPAELEALIRLAVRVPDHGKLSPWRLIVLEGAGKAAFETRLSAIAGARNDPKLAAKLGKLKAPPVGIAVVSRPSPSEIPEWEQLMSAGAVCVTLLYAAHAMGYGANWITDWYAYDPEAGATLGLDAAERVAGFIFIGTPNTPPLERERPDALALVTRYAP